MSPQTQPATMPSTSPSLSLPRRSTFASVMSSTQQGKEWASAIADSPVRHAILNKPFTLLRMRTESLLDTITGGTLPSTVHEAERRQKDADRQLKCRGCKVLFGDERGLLRHHDLFPAHVNPPEYKRKPKRRTSRRSQSTSNVLTSPPAPKVAITRHMRAATMVNPETVADDVDAPLPIDSMPEFKEVHQPRRSRPRPLPPTPSQRELDAAEHEQQEAASLSAFTRTPQASDAMPGSFPNLAQSPPLLPALDFNSESFKLISQETGKSPIHARPVTKSTGNNAIEEKNRAAGAASALSMATRQEEKRKLTRGASESALDTLTIPNTIQDAARAIIATGKAGRLEPAVVGGSMTPKAQAMYAALSGEEDIKATTPSSKSSPTINWSILKGPLVDAPEKKIYPDATGPTTFSRYQDGLPLSKQNSPTTTFPRLLTRKSTNPFLNDAFMSSVSTSKTPPLSPSSPLATFSRTPTTLNPFSRLPDEPFNFNNADDEEYNFFLNAPPTPLDLNPNPTSATITSNKSKRNPFIRRDSDDNHDIVSYLPRSESAPILSTISTIKATRGVHFDAETALKASDSPRCPSCRRAFIDLQSVLSHVDGSDCNPFYLNEGQSILAA